ncbi:carbohydrate ABC transporter permease [Paenibacillus eucommiae]|uniref:Multiple sugar transport system permease protein n=1 Tax=Paenibacillus eucommiae TaxID=1355755 RepID=A0ABS4ILQ7_9BACL|nr:sugar ABC transporter permease [Paenibacillus eucommiae]MBP1988508.1 multiple sugar transport system permease protein [Paenibacillus eucommiae]
MTNLAKPRISAFRQDSLWAWAMIAPAVLGLLIFMWGPVVYVMALGFFEWDLITAKQFVGISNYARLVKDPMFYHSLKVTFQYVCLFVPATIIASMFLSILLNRIRFAVLFRTLFFLPAVCMTVATSLVWTLIYNPQTGLFNALLGLLGIPGLKWIYDPSTAVASIALMGIWLQAGYNTVFYLAALQNIPKTIYEAAEIDGATSWKKILYVTIPLLSPTTFFLLIINVIGSFQAFDQLYVMTKGGPGDATTTLVYYIYQQAFQNYSVGYASSLSAVLFLLVIIVTIVQFAVQKKWVNYER